MSNRIIITKNFIDKTKSKGLYQTRPYEAGSVPSIAKEILVRKAVMTSTFADPLLKNEAGFGCGLCVIGEPATMSQVLIVKSEDNRLRFSGDDFFNKSGKVVTSASAILFTEDGIFASV